MDRRGFLLSVFAVAGGALLVPGLKKRTERAEPAPVEPGTGPGLMRNKYNDPPEPSNFLHEQVFS